MGAYDIRGLYLYTFVYGSICGWFIKWRIYLKVSCSTFLPSLRIAKTSGIPVKEVMRTEEASRKLFFKNSQKT
ncbi:MAG: hypothetical protein H5T43_09150 [Methanomethylovorans sp.]|jgi:uncharacterized membrane protein YciS (DUF1049 family)|nr:hypothetical protein [Methanomethylovorans sp.]